ncbi:conserved hypothetical protein [Brugia malayi]|uniref:Bm328 n=1 Tax=Brugia malayi TaxID=6279 RepID=A0A0K0J9K7_BRUMA|nr:uncharacterized protein BM_BM328 [Brugia malayi]CDP93137.1 Bm328 [Brugia malayi]VIO87311.1 conserved hypothetical protein [Brugia malayi]
MKCFGYCRNQGFLCGKKNSIVQDLLKQNEFSMQHKIYIHGSRPLVYKFPEIINFHFLMALILSWSIITCDIVLKSQPLSSCFSV